MQVVSAIIVRLTDTTDDNKLDIWCLIDNICKRVGGRYRNAFAERLLMLVAYEMPRADSKMRERFGKLIETWRKVFPDCMQEVYARFSEPQLKHGIDAPRSKRVRV